MFWSIILLYNPNEFHIRVNLEIIIRDFLLGSCIRTPIMASYQVPDPYTTTTMFGLWYDVKCYVNFMSDAQLPESFTRVVSVHEIFPWKGFGDH